jgi:hypothetical protein
MQHPSGIPEKIVRKSSPAADGCTLQCEAAQQDIVKCARGPLSITGRAPDLMPVQNHAKRICGASTSRARMRRRPCSSDEDNSP